VSATTVFVTGGAGYIGSHACKALATAGYEPIAYDNLSRGHAHAVKWGPIVQGDILDSTALRTAFEQYRPIAVLHFAAFAYVNESVAEPTMYYRNNFCGALNLLEAMREHACRQIVFSSTCATYGMATDGQRITEDHPQAPINPYGRSKWMVEHLLRDCSAAFNIRSVALRYFNAAGADADGDLGEEHDPETHIIPLALLTAAGKCAAFDIYGTDYPTPDGTAIRDYIHVTDLADAHVAALKYLTNGGATTALNLGTGQGFSVREVLNAAQRASKRKINAREMPRREGDPPALVADARRARAVLNWEPRLTDLDTIIATAWRTLR
jgi:UDP-glucose-4-epimerase GalE